MPMDQLVQKSNNNIFYFALQIIASVETRLHMFGCYCQSMTKQVRLINQHSVDACDNNLSFQ